MHIHFRTAILIYHPRLAWLNYGRKKLAQHAGTLDDIQPKARGVSVQVNLLRH